MDIVPTADALDEETPRRALETRVGRQPTGIPTTEHAIAIAVRTGRARHRLKIARLLASAPEEIDHPELEEILLRHGLLESWRELRSALR